MISLQLDLSVFERKAREIGGAIDQVPFALSQAMNEAVKVARTYEIDTVWPAHVEVRNRNFLRAALRMEFADKRKLRVSIYDTLGRAHLGMHDKGGTKRARGRLAIPTDRVKRTRRGAIADKLKPGNLPNAFVRGKSVYQRIGKGRRQTIRRMFSLAPSARIKPDVPFTSEFVRVMRREMQVRFGPAMQKAMRSRR